MSDWQRTGTFHMKERPSGPGVGTALGCIAEGEKKEPTKAPHAARTAGEDGAGRSGSKAAHYRSAECSPITPNVTPLPTATATVVRALWP